MLAGGLTKSNTLGVVGGYPVPGGEPDHQRLHRRRAGESTRRSRSRSPSSTAGSIPATAKEAALAQIGAGADVLYAERFGVIEAAQENDLVAVGNMADQKELAPSRTSSPA